MADGKRLFHTGHANLKSPGAAPDAAGELAAAIKAGRLIDVQPSVVLVPAALEEGQMKYFADYSPAEASALIRTARCAWSSIRGSTTSRWRAGT